MNDRSRRLLAVNWEMPPLSGPRAVQVSQRLNALVPLGWESSVVCFGPRSNRYGQDYELAARLRAPGVTLVPVPSLEERFVFRALWRLVPRLKIMPDEKRVWVRAAVQAARRAASERRFDVLVSFAQPWSDHLIGLQLRRLLELPWVAHFSDPWVDSPYPPYSTAPAWQRRLWLRMEADVVREADAVVFVNRQTADQVMLKYPAAWRSKVAIVPHGHDGAPVAPAGPRGAPLRIVYTGRFYEGYRTPEPLLRALGRLSRTRPLARELKVIFAGTIVPAYVDLAHALALDDVVEFVPRLPREASMALAAGGDVLLVIDAPGDNNLFLPSKLIEYLPLNKPILGLTPRRGATADVLGELSYPVAPPDDEQAIASAVESLLAQHTAGALATSAQHGTVSRRYEISCTARAFNDVLLSCAPR
jgi:glycosyltransferase involved in cell wall biosynthesis